jgi:MFS family permease
VGTSLGFFRNLSSNLRLTFAALQYPNYRLWFAGQLVSMVGTWMQNTAQGFLIFQLTNSPAYLGYVAFAAGLPSWLFTLYGGVVADRISRRKLLIITQFSMLVLAFLQAGLVFSGLVQPWHILVLAFFLGIANAFDAPARQSFVLEMVDRQDLTNAIALNSIMFNMATVVGPAVAGFTYYLLGPGWCFTINGISFIAVIFALILMKLQPAIISIETGNVLTQLKEGLQYTRRNSTIMGMLFLVGTVSLFANGMMTLIPAWSVNILHGDASTNGLMLSARGFGSMIGGLLIAWMSRFQIRGKLLSIASLILPICIAIFSIIALLPLSILFMAATGLCFMLVLNNANALMQTTLPDNMRGRGMSIFTLIFFGSVPIGSLLAGQLAEMLGESTAVLVLAFCLAICVLFVWFRLPGLRSSK